MSELKTIDLVYFILIFISFIYFPLFFIIDQRQRRQKCNMVTCHMSQSQKSHAHMTQWNNIEGSREDDIIWHG